MEGESCVGRCGRLRGGVGIWGSGFVVSDMCCLLQGLVAYHVAVFIGMLIALCELPNANAVE